MLMYQKDSDVGINVSQAQVKTLEKAGWSKKAGKVKEEVADVEKKVEPKKVESTTVTPAKPASTVKSTTSTDKK